MKALDFLDDHFGWVLAIGIPLAVTLLVLGICLISNAVSESACNQRAEVLDVRSGDYRFLSAECYLTLQDGTVIPASQYRAVEETPR